ALSRADTNHDGKVSFEELKAVHPRITRERFDKMDRNHDGFLSEADRSGGGKNGVKKIANDPDARGALFQSLMATDANHDGKVSFEEVSAAKPGYSKADFDRMDRNKDGFITAEDAPRTPQVAQQSNAPAAPAGLEMREALREKLRAADTNHDGYVTREEA